MCRWEARKAPACFEHPPGAPDPELLPRYLDEIGLDAVTRLELLYWIDPSSGETVEYPWPEEMSGCAMSLEMGGPETLWAGTTSGVGRLDIPCGE